MAATRLNPRTPGVYIEEIRVFPPSVAQVPTAIPVFIGYTGRAVDEAGNDISGTPTPKRISSMLEYERLFGGANLEPAGALSVDIVTGAGGAVQVFGRVDQALRSPYHMYYALQWFYINGGGDAWIVAVGDYSNSTIVSTELIAGLNASNQVDEITLIVFPDAQNVSNASNYADIYHEAMDACADLQDRFTIMDVWIDRDNPAVNNIDVFRTSISNSAADRLKYGASYYPNMMTNLDYVYTSGPDDLSGEANVAITGYAPAATLDALRGDNNALYNRALQALRDIPLEMPPSPAIAGIYASVDNARGVWKAPANVGIDFVIEPVLRISDAQQAGLNVDENGGRSINVIRSFTGRGTLVWGARTLMGNDNEWRYINVRRFFNMVEESVKKATEGFVFEPNDKNTWTQVRAMIENFLTIQWGAGALQGKIPSQAFYVKVGLGETMSALDVLEGRMIVEIGMAVVRPAEFIILQFMHKLPEA